MVRPDSSRAQQKSEQTPTGIEPAQGMACAESRAEDTRQKTSLGRGKSKHWCTLLSQSHLAKYLLIYQHEKYNI